VRILFDHNTPAPLAGFLRGHDVTRAAQRGWQMLTNGTLLTEAESAGFELLLTCDQNVPYQQNLTGKKIALLILSTNQWPKVRPHCARIARIVDLVQSGEVVRVDLAADEI